MDAPAPAISRLYISPYMRDRPPFPAACLRPVVTRNLTQIKVSPPPGTQPDPDAVTDKALRATHRGANGQEFVL